MYENVRWGSPRWFSQIKGAEFSMRSFTAAVIVFAKNPETAQQTSSLCLWSKERNVGGKIMEKKLTKGCSKYFCTGKKTKQNVEDVQRA